MKKPIHKAIISFDFDLTIAHTDYPHIRHLKENAKEVLNRLYDDDIYVIVWSCRSGEQQLEAENFLLKQGVKFHQVNEHHPYLIEVFKNNTRKISADIQVDDKNLESLLNPNFPDFLEIEKQIYQIINNPKFNTILNS